MRSSGTCITLFFNFVPVHYRPGPLSPMTWPCPNGCGRVYLQKGNLSRHMKYECGVTKKFGCFICGKFFARKESYKGHMLLKHHTLP